MDVEDFVPASAEPLPLFWMNTVTPHYFHVTGIPILAGRDLTEADGSGNPLVALVTAATARRHWPNQSAIGKYIRLLGHSDWHMVVGVAQDVRAYRLLASERYGVNFVDPLTYLAAAAVMAVVTLSHHLHTHAPSDAGGSALREE